MENSKNKGRLLKNYKKSFKTNIKYEWKQYIHVCKEYKASSGDTKKCIVASTASPYKFVKSVMGAIAPDIHAEDELVLLPKLQELSGVDMPQAICDILDAKILHEIECDTDKMEDAVKSILGV